MLVAFPSLIFQMIAVHSYEKQNDDELELATNDLVQILPWEDESLKVRSLPFVKRVSK